jgi:chromosome partitioning protein
VNPLIETVREYGPLFVILGATATVLGVAFTFYRTSHGRHVRLLKDRIRQLEKQLEGYQGKDPSALEQLVAELRQRLAAAGSERAEAVRQWAGQREQFEAAAAGQRQEYEACAGTKEGLARDLEAARDELARRDQAETRRANLLRKALRIEGRVWERKVVGHVPRFRPLHERHVPVVSVLNLKGGVGKTTVTAHLGAAFAAKGYRVLLLDLDLQGSLSSLFVHESVLTERSKKRLLLQHYLTAAAERHKARLLDFCVPVLGGDSAVVPTADSMAYAELNLTMQWLLRLGKRDTRFLLRRPLHQKQLTNRFDLVLMDCPPLLNTCCVNALAASDYIVIPVIPSTKAAERVPLLLDRLKRLHGVINPDLQVAGLLLNRTYGAQLTAWERDLWSDVRERAKDRWKLPVHAFETVVRQTTEVRDSETEFTPPPLGSELHGLFARLAAELEERLPRDCRRTAGFSVGPG